MGTDCFFGYEGINLDSVLALTKPVIMPQLCLPVPVIYYLFTVALDGITAGPSLPQLQAPLARPWLAGVA